MIHHPVHLVGVVVFVGLYALALHTFSRALRRPAKDSTQHLVRFLLLTVAVAFMYFYFSELRLALVVPHIISVWTKPQIVQVFITSAVIALLPYILLVRAWNKSRA